MNPRDSNISESNTTKELKKYISIDIDESVTKEEVIEAINALKQLSNIDIVYAEPRGRVIPIDINRSVLPLPNAPTPNLI